MSNDQNTKIREDQKLKFSVDSRANLKWEDLFKDIREDASAAREDAELEKDIGFSEVWPTNMDDANPFGIRRDIETDRISLQRYVRNCSSSDNELDDEEEEDKTLFISLVERKRLRHSDFGPLTQSCWENNIIWGDNSPGESYNSSDFEEGDDDEDMLTETPRKELDFSRKSPLNIKNRIAFSTVNGQSRVINRRDKLWGEILDDNPGSVSAQRSDFRQRKNRADSGDYGDVDVEFVGDRNERQNAFGADRSPSSIAQRSSAMSASMPRELQLNRTFASFEWLKCVLWGTRKRALSIAQQRMRALVLDENDPNMVFEVFKPKPLTIEGLRAKRARELQQLNDDQYAFNALARAKNEQRKHGESDILHIKVGENTWLAENLFDSAYAPELTKVELRSFHRPRASFETRRHRAKVCRANRMTLRDKETSTMRAATSSVESLIPPVGNWAARVRKYKDLSLRSGDAILLEHVEQYPACTLNIGMVCRLVNACSADPSPSTKMTAYDGFVKRHTDEHGATAPIYGQFHQLLKRQRIPIMGGTEVKPGDTVRLVGNKLYNAPVVQHRNDPRDFILVRLSSQKYFIRKMPTIFAVGQHTPKQLVYTPESERFKTFQGEYVAFHILKLSRYFGEKAMTMRHLEATFPSAKTTMLQNKKKAVKEGTINEDQIKASIEPYKVCMFEGMKHGQWRLGRKGIREQQKINQTSRTVGAFILSLREKAQKLAEGDANTGRSDYERAMKRLETALFIYRQLLITPWASTKAFFECVLDVDKGSKNRQILDLSEIVEKPCKSLDPLGGVADGFALVSRSALKSGRRRKSGSKKSAEANDGEAAAKRAARKNMPIQKLKKAVKRLNCTKSNVDDLPKWKLIRILNKAEMGGGRLKSVLARYRKQIQSIFQAHMNFLRKKQDDDDESSDEISDDELDDIDEEQESVRRHQSSGPTRDEELEGEKLMQSMREESEDRKLIKLKSILKEKLETTSIGNGSRYQASSGSSNFASRPGSNFSSRLQSIASSAIATPSAGHSRPGSCCSSRASSAMPSPKSSRPPSPTSRGMSRNVSTSKRMILCKELISYDENGVRKVRKIYFTNKSKIKAFMKNREKEKAKEQGQGRLKITSRRDKRATLKTLNREAEQKEIDEKIERYKKEKDRREQVREEFKRWLDAGRPKKKGQRCCQRCGMPGHTRSSSSCPLAEIRTGSSMRGGNVKIKLSKAKLDSAKEKKVSIKISTRKITEAKVKERQKRRQRQMADAYDLVRGPAKKRNRSSLRRKDNPQNKLNSAFDNIVTSLWNNKSFSWFRFKVPSNLVNLRGETYSVAVPSQMHLTMIRERAKRRGYTSRSEFLKDIKKIADNACRFNGMTHEVAVLSQKMLQEAKRHCEDERASFERWEREIEETKRQKSIASGAVIRRRSGGGKQLIGAALASTKKKDEDEDDEEENSSDEDDGVEEVIASGTQGL